MKYYSEILKKTFDTEEECVKAEENQELLKAQRKERADEIMDAIKDYDDYVAESNKIAREKADKIKELRNKFIEDYGSFNMTYKTTVPIERAPTSIFDIIQNMFSF